MTTTWSTMREVQPVATRMLQNSIVKDRIAHAYLFHGPKGTGKQKASLLFAMRYFCEQADKSYSEPCYECSSCKRIQTGNHPDVHFIEPDGQSIKKDQIEYLQKEFTYTGLESNQKVYVLHQAEKMTTNAANRLLKFLEEPSRQTVAILLTENTGSVLNTILSRCQRIQFHPLKSEDMYEQFVGEGIPESTAKICAALNIGLDEAKELSQDSWFAEARRIVIQLIDKVMNPKEEGYLFLHQVWLNHFQERHQQELGIDLLLLWYQDLISSHLNREDMVVLTDQLDRLQQYQYTISLSDAKTCVYELLQTKRKLAYNVHNTLAMEHLVLQLQR
ncbi:DNA polymerase III subunit delta' [Alkalibacillus haloalkaliphilus]|uniref:DNA polymerase III subunit delta' n=1 Tax=Alkalibacillus haloalkaliphilus TaxID=94136 RepID=UPI0029368E92|nr:DNA polymerase III subunit delta' [Alkalibacillus haloalkaliphilus]MDV2583269.1 DNA polymerase III subunit delta' [Alkalibacillus haloalkaliphilus]